MRFHCLQHVDFESPAFIADWITENGHSISYTRFFENSNISQQQEFDFLIIMGGPMGVYDEQKFGWLKSEKDFIKQTIQQGKKILGICLGSQLLAESLGAKVFGNKFKEIGYLPITVQNNTHNFFSHFKNTETVFHWHGDTFELPKGAELIASSDVCKNQAFLYNNCIVGLQFHIEIKQNLIEQLIENAGHELVDAPYIQSQSKILEGNKHHERCNWLLAELLRKMCL